MEQIGEYHIIEHVDESRNAVIYRARKEGVKETIIIKAIKPLSASSAGIARFKQEYALIKDIEHENIIRYLEFLELDNRIALVLEDFNGHSLKNELRNTTLKLGYFLDIAVAITRGIAELHRLNIVHKDIKSSNILINTTTGAVKLTDFGIAAELTGDKNDIYHPDVIQGTLLYLSPEQTGRMNRPIDYRTDFYSLGITFYEMLTGGVPFQSTDPMEIIHYHIARQPIPPHLVNTGIPEMISHIVMKLLEKTAEERYQNAFGILWDLEACRISFTQTGRIEPFTLATRDIALRFHIPPILCGREREIKTLMESFERVNRGTQEVVMVMGPAGIGKSAVINEIHKPIVARRGYFLSGKYDQFRIDVPYSAIIQSFLGLVKQILAESDERLAEWKRELAAALGVNGRVIANVIPDIEHIIGKQPPIADLGPDESRNRMNMVFKNFVSVFAGPGHPVVLFLDDLQWADAASFTMLQSLLTEGDISHFQLIGSYRDSEVDASHPVILLQNEIRTAGIPLRSIILGPLSAAQTNMIIGGALHCSGELSKPLADLIWKKTGGNPFFISQFLKTLYNDRMIELDPARGWRWDIEQIRNAQVTDNVVELMVEKIRNLPERTIEILKTCAAIGNRFDLETLATVQNRTIDETLADLVPAIDEELVFRMDDLYRFHHDRIQEAAYSLFDEEGKRLMHQRIGSYLLENIGEEELQEKILYVVNHLNAALELMTGDAERLRVVSLNLMAIRKAKISNAHEIALKLARRSMSLLGDRDWAGAYVLCFSMHLERAECEFLNRHYDEAARFFDTVMRQAQSPLERARVLDKKATLFFSIWKIDECVDSLMRGLRELGIRLPLKPKRPAFLWEIYRERIKRPKRIVEDLSALPESRDPETVFAMNMLMSLILSSFFTNFNLSSYCIPVMVNMAYRRGNTEYSSYAYIVYAFIVGTLLDDHKRAREFAHLAIALTGRYNNPGVTAKTLSMFGGLVNHWTAPMHTSLEPLDRAYRLSLDSGDLLFLGFVTGYILFIQMARGERLDEIMIQCKKFMHPLKRAKNLSDILLFSAIGLIQNLQGQSPVTFSFDSEFFQEDSLKKVRNATMIYWHAILKARLYYLFHEYDRAREQIDIARKNLLGVLPNVPSVDFYILYIIIVAAQWPLVPPGDRVREWKKLVKYRRRLQRFAANCPENYAHQHLLADAEMARLAGDGPGALELFERSVQSARVGGFIHHEAMASECAAQFHRDAGHDDFARLYLENAVRCYTAWGAPAKTRDVMTRYREVFGNRRDQAPGSRRTDDTASSGLTSTSSATQTMDMSAIMKASQVLASEIDLGGLLGKIMKFSIENAGAQKGFLILENHNDRVLTIEAAGTVDDRISVLQSIPVASSVHVPQSIVNYVHKTMETVVLADAMADSRFVNDPYIAQSRARSVLCSPIMHQGKQAGILYLENNLATNVFTPERLETLGILSAQAAISITNSRLMEQREEAARLQRDMEIAANIQSALLPDRPAMEGYEMTALVRPADEVGGDYYDVINTPERDWVIIGDVSGHGVPSGLIMMMVQTTIQALVREDPLIDPSRLLTVVNRAICYNVQKMNLDKYMTIIALSFGRDGAIRYSGLHLDMLLYRAAEGVVETVISQGMWLSPWDMDWDRDNLEFSMMSGDVLLLYTDGITEALDASRRMFSVDRLTDVLLRNGASGPMGTRDAILSALGSYVTTDDMTMVIIRKR